jgi:hypothetical protein
LDTHTYQCITLDYRGEATVYLTMHNVKDGVYGPLDLPWVRQSAACLTEFARVWGVDLRFGPPQ